ncbi:MAG: hypothetical protein ABIJ61_01780, partial [bacterium]
MNERIVYRHLDPEASDLISEALALHNTTYGDNRDRQHWDWEYPGRDPRTFVYTVALLGDRVIGSQGMIPINLIAGGRRTPTAKSENSLLDARFRGGTTFVDLYEYAISLSRDRGMTCIWGFTTAVKVMRKLGFHVHEGAMARAKLVVSLLSTLAHIRSLRPGLARGIGLVTVAVGSWLYGRLRMPIVCLGLPSRKEFQLETKLRDCGDVRDLYERIRKSWPDMIHIDQDGEYLAWRLDQNPDIDYETLFLYHDG